mmetsp:Transcript_25741/g.60087  ORF Transcript_25741/g.60087 Transcript_25741/m.60087 type:complete len:128 (+) Transcript_25741:92-475(+)|eukprot:CAMPEP_0178411046 /NCGR_PEP_ID=MMETSP0689_2-20121128/21294_1 /TAXON_ID=160604 /ORGANISM="Amphidinium massartii, Strain CS-259" /LENGTH=127 /DNA_ID=CAMNT_0020032243 /DNA_START=86 /DNA_END=469 /DNA_ORIENTATION=+
MAMQANFQQIGEQFCQHYYNTFDTNRAGLQPLYSDQSLLTFEDSQVSGSQAIVQKLASLPFRTVKHQIVKVDCQPCPGSMNVLIFVTGNLVVDENPNPLKFAQVFQLAQAPGGNYFCQNDLFRLNIG